MLVFLTLFPNVHHVNAITYTCLFYLLCRQCIIHYEFRILLSGRQLFSLQRNARKCLPFKKRIGGQRGQDFLVSDKRLIRGFQSKGAASLPISTRYAATSKGKSHMREIYCSLQKEWLHHFTLYILLPIMLGLQSN